MCFKIIAKISLYCLVHLLVCVAAHIATCFNISAVVMSCFLMVREHYS